jgi:serine/threonine-protein kinase
MGLFLDEARVASNLAHANIVQTLDLGLESDTLFIAMEYVPGPPLSRVIKELKDRGRLLPPHLVAYIGAKMAHALDFAHRRVTTAQGQPLALVHRDISPQNILVSRSGIVKLMDFGVARASIQMHKTKTGQVRGKAAYMAPEQVRAQALDGRTDMFALGLVLYEMLTAYRPFQRNNEIASMRAIIGEDVPPLADRNPDVPPELAAAVARCLRRPPDERYAHCGEL